MQWVLLCFLLTCGGCAGTTIVSCRNEQGHAVDWYILYKLPHIADDSGLKYLYMDESTNGWDYANNTINNTESALGHTLKPFFEHVTRKTKTFGYILYNDQPPKPYHTASSSFGHSKGVLMMDKMTGIWLSHSTPHFPGPNKKTFWPDSGYHNGQTFICGTYKYTTFRDIALQLQYIHVFSFVVHIPESFYPELQCVANMSCHPKKEPWFREQGMTSLAGHKFVSYAKYSRFHNDLYSGLLVNYLGGDLYAKSWGKMHHPLPSNCSALHDIFNVKSMQLPSAKSFSITVDHSKWCVTVEKSLRQWTCIADMNREVSQEGRGGGAVCTDHYAVWKAFRNIVGTYEPCT